MEDCTHPIETIVTPITPYLICDHFISTELQDDNLLSCYTKDKALQANDLLKKKNYDEIKNLDIVQVQVNYFSFFCDEILPILCKNKVKVVVITYQWQLPQLNRTDKTDALLANDNVILWVSQNPIYANHAKYMPFPYGISQFNVSNYAAFLKSANNPDKTTKLLNQYSSVHHHLPANHIRKVHEIFGQKSGDTYLSYTDFLTNISKAEFVISTAGDREDCYRHYECIGLDAVPISNIEGGYKEIFGESMIYSNAEEMVHMVTTKTVTNRYEKPNKDVITVAYWVSKMQEKIKERYNISLF